MLRLLADEKLNANIVCGLLRRVERLDLVSIHDLV